MLVFFPALVLISLERTESKQVENQSLIFIVGKGSVGVHACLYLLADAFLDSEPWG